MRSLILVFLVTFSILYSKDLYKQYTKDFESLDRKQLETLIEIHKRAKAFDLSYSMVAIAWQESNLGKWPINLSDPSCGPFHQTVGNYLKRYKINDNDFTRNKACMDLIENIDLSTSTAISEMEAWLSIHNKRWNKFEYAYRSYNAGYNYNSEKAIEYARKINIRIRVLKNMNKKYKLFD